jgi:lysophospholipase L1-like esterase
MMVKAIAAALALAGLIATGGPVAAAPPETLAKACGKPPPGVQLDDSLLTRTMRKLRRDKTLKIVALGSSTTVGSGGSGVGASWPARLQDELSKRLPGINVSIVNKGQMRQSAQQMIDRLSTDVLNEKPDIVIWETGTNEAARGLDVETFTAAMLDGISRMEAAGVEVVLMNTQYSRNTARLINFQPYNDAMSQVAQMRDLVLFPRYETMQAWVDKGLVSFDGLSQAEAVKIADTVYDCIGKLLAQNIALALKTGPAK